MPFQSLRQAATSPEALAEAWWMANETNAKAALSILDGMPATDAEVAISAQPTGLVLVDSGGARTLRFGTDSVVP